MSCVLFRVAWARSGAPRGRRFQSELLAFPLVRGLHALFIWDRVGFTQAPLFVAGFIWVRVVSIGRAKGSQGSFRLWPT